MPLVLRRKQPFPSLPARISHTITVFVSLLLLVALWFSGLPGLAYYRLNTVFSASTDLPSLALNSYRADIQAQPMAQLPNNVSGLTYSPPTGTLFTVINKPPLIAEISTNGQILRKIEIEGVVDPEGITHAGGNRFIVADERSQSLHWIIINPETKMVSVDGGDRLRLNIGAVRNMGFEGLSWDSIRKRLYITQEMFPSRVITVDGLDATMATNGIHLDIGEWTPRGFAGTFMLDLSSASLHEETGNLILLSHMSGMLVEHAPDGTVLSFLSLWKGLNGLAHSIGQAEGVAIGPNGDIFIVSEPNLFYRFTRKTEAGTPK